MSQLSAWNFNTLKHKINNAVPQRVLLCIFGFLGIVNAYTMRLSLDITLMHMILNKDITSTPTVSRKDTTLGFRKSKRLSSWSMFSQGKALLPSSFTFATTPAPVPDTFDWSTQVQNFILAAFYVGYVIGHVPAGQLAEKYGGKWVLGVGILATAVFTLLTPTAVKVGGPIALIVIRFLIGLSESPTYPALVALLAKWVPARERGKLGVLVLSGGQAGVFVVNFMSSLLLRWFDWSMIFYFFGFCSLLWVILFAQFCHSDPETHPSIKEQEKQYLRTEIKSVTPKAELAPTPWKAIFSSVPMWALISATVQYDWSQYTEVSEVTKLLQEVKQVPMKESLFSSVCVSMPYILKWLVSLISGVLVDALITNNILSTSGARKIMTSIAAFGPQLFNGFVSCFSCGEKEDPKGFIAMLQCAFGVVGTFYAGIKLTPLDMSPNYAGTLTGIANGFGAVTGLIAPHWEKLSPIQSSNLKELRSLLWVACTALSSGEVQPFNDPNAIQTVKND